MRLRTLVRTIRTLGKGVVTGIDPAIDHENPFDLFAAWYADADESGLLHPEAMTLATASSEGIPSARTVLLKEVDDDGFVFYTNYGSRKSRELSQNPVAALVFHWAVLERQVFIEGRVERVSREQAADYHHSRPRASQIGAWASKQSETLPARDSLESRVRDFTRKYEGREIPLPEFWGGHRVRPTRFEFWQGRASRLHDRLVFELDGKVWTTRRLYP